MNYPSEFFSSKFTFESWALTTVNCISSPLFLDFVKMFLIRIIKQRSVSTLRWSALRCWVFRSAYSCKSPASLWIRYTIKQFRKTESVWCSLSSLRVTGGTLQDRRGSSASLLHITGEPRVRDFVCYTVYKKQILFFKKLKSERRNWTISCFLPVVIIAFDVNNVASLSHVRWAKLFMSRLFVLILLV